MEQAGLGDRLVDGLTVDGDLFLRTATVTGEVRLLGAHIGGQLCCIGATLSNDGGPALRGDVLTVDGAVYMSPDALQGGIDLTHARVGAWYDNESSWPAWLRLEGFTYEAIHAPEPSARSRLRWVERHQGGYTPQPYEQLAGVYRRAGEDSSARTVAIAKQQARRASPKEWWARWPSRAWSFFLRWTIGYGYRPTLVLPYLVGLFAVGSLILNHADHAHPSMLAPTKTGPAQPGFNAARYTLDLLLPVANLRQRDAFILHGYATWWVFGLTLGGWLLALVLVAGLTGVFKRD